MTAEILRYAAFTVDGKGGNPAGVVLDASGLDAAQMQAIATEVGDSETAFLVARDTRPNVYDVRYFSPTQEVPFCGHATIASAIALVERSPADVLIFHTPAGFVSITTFQNDKGELVAELTSVAPGCPNQRPTCSWEYSVRFAGPPMILTRIIPCCWQMPERSIWCL